LPSGVAVPGEFFMIVVDETDRGLRTLAVILPQEVPAGARLEDYRVSIQEVERRTGLDFFHELEVEVQAVLEAAVAPRVW
jgi:endonuclease G, mitochondrial